MVKIQNIGTDLFYNSVILLYKQQFVEPINNVQFTIYNRADVAIQAVFCKSLYIVNCKLFIDIF